MELPVPSSERTLALGEKTETFVTFWLGEFYFGLPISEVVEINRKLEITPVPLAPAYIRGIVNLRGQVLTAIDLARRIGLDGENAAEYNLIVRDEDEDKVSLLVERIGDILEVPVESIEEPPEKIEGMERRFVRWVCQLPERLLVILHTRELFQESG
ncbi:chemotaxis protein CheW [Thermosulfurimonas marina]|uniref:chemotaxis protein CheW n=1 Tax=Thermosulfurimonas marina TaxID=2047767 RepID=UPI00144AC1CB|nr:chemotaxis protein CheW [Thermosulfurimonas marina]